MYGQICAFVWACVCVMLHIPKYIELEILALIQRPCRVAVIDET